MKNPHIITVSGPSLSGKTEFTKILLNEYDFNVVVSLTTRPIRGQEKDGVDYHFISKEKYETLSMVQKTHFNSHYYGVSEDEVLMKKDKPLLWVIAPGSIGQVEDYCTKKGWDITKVFISNPQNVIFERLFTRFKEDSNADPSVYAKRLNTMVNEEIKWIEQSKTDGMYDFVADSFTKDNKQQVIDEFLMLVNRKQKKNKFNM